MAHRLTSGHQADLLLPQGCHTVVVVVWRVPTAGRRLGYLCGARQWRPIAWKVAVVGHGPVLMLTLEKEELDLMREALYEGEQLAACTAFSHLPVNKISFGTILRKFQQKLNYN
jgi:hypothetical protein